MVEWSNPFTDVSETDEFYDAVRFANENGLIFGVSDTEFAPDVIMNRAMFVTILGRAEKIPEDSSEVSRFEDVEADTWYSPYVDWADKNRIVNGYSETAFGPEDNISIEQACVILARYADYLGIDTTAELLDSESGFEDVDDISGWAAQGMAWAVKSGILIPDGTELNPKAPSTRAMVAMMIYRLVGVMVDSVN